MAVSRRAWMMPAPKAAVSGTSFRYKGHELNFELDVIAVLYECPELIMVAIEERAKQRPRSKK